MEAVIILLAVLLVAQSAVVALAERRHQDERAALLDDMRKVHRQAMRAVMAKNGVEFDIAEARGHLLEEMGSNRPNPAPTREQDPPLEGLG